jgi:hypothetical protein
MDGIAATVNAGIRGVSPARVFQYIASSLLGSDAYDGGGATVLLGVVLHFSVALGAATAFYLISSRLPILLRRPVICGMVYGIVVFFTMRYAVVPLTRVTQAPFKLSAMITGVVIHMFCVGLPIALWARRSITSSTEQVSAAARE